MFLEQRKKSAALRGDLRRDGGESGISLIELLFSIGAIALVLVTATQFVQGVVNREFTRSVAGYMTLIHDSALEYVKDIDRYNSLFALANAQPGNVLEIPIEDGLTGINSDDLSLEAGGSTLPKASFITEDFRPTLPSGQEATVLVRAVESGGSRYLVIVTATIDPIAEGRLRDVAVALGPQAGYISALVPADNDPCASEAECADTMRSVYNMWREDLADYNGTRLFASPAATVEDGGYLLKFSFVPESLVAGDYMFRVQQAQTPELNRMQSPLNMGGHSIVGADNVIVNGDLSIRDEVHAQGSVFAGTSLLATGDVQVNGDVRSDVLSIVPGYADNPNLSTVGISRGSVVVEQVINADNFSLTESLSAQNGNFENVTSSAVRAQTLNTQNLDSTGSAGLFSRRVQAQSITNQGRMRVGDITVNSDTNVRGLGAVNLDNGNGTTSVSGNSAGLVPRLNVRNARINNLRRCETGC